MEMTYEEYQTYVLQNMNTVDGFPDNYVASLQKVTKNNGLKLVGLLIHDPEVNISPTIYLEYYYNHVKNGTLTPEESLQAIWQVYEKNKMITDIDVQNILYSEKSRTQIYPKLINAKANQELLKTSPHKMLEDLAVVYELHVPDVQVEGCHGNIKITDELLDKIGIPREEIYDLALHNAERDREVFFTSMYDLLKNMMTEDEVAEENFWQDFKETAYYENPMYVLSNTEKYNGATSLLYDNVLKECSEKCGGADMVILPSSIHETILIPIQEINENDLSVYSKIVYEVNCTNVSMEEKLSDTVYAYDREKDRFMTLENYVNEKNMEFQKEMKLEGFTGELNKAQEKVDLQKNKPVDIPAPNKGAERA